MSKKGRGGSISISLLIFIQTKQNKKEEHTNYFGRDSITTHIIENF